MIRMFHRILRHIRRKFILFLLDNSPFLSGDSFAKLVDYRVYGRSKKSEIDLIRLRNARSLFIPGDQFRPFLAEYYGEVNARVLIIGNSDENFDETIKLPDSVTLCLIQNSTISDGKRIFTLPIGLENRRLGRAGNPNLYKERNVIAKLKVYVPPMSPTNPVRTKVLSHLQTHPSSCFEIDSKYVEIHKYIENVRKYKFILCLEGNGYENHRIWEALYLGVFPVVLETAWSDSLRYLGLPILFIREISEVTEQKLSEFCRLHEGFRAKEMETLWIPFWKKWVGSHY